MKRIVYLGFDPGAYTGIAWTKNYVSQPSHELMHAVHTPYAACDLIYEVLKEWHNGVIVPDRIIVSGEAYVMGSSVKSHQPDALNILGAVSWMLHRFFPHAEYTTVGASSAAGTGTRQTLTAAGWWTVADEDQHNNRAAAQVAHA